MDLRSLAVAGVVAMFIFFNYMDAQSALHELIAEATPF
jgi:hypothetical protein